MSFEQHLIPHIFSEFFLELEIMLYTFYHRFFQLLYFICKQYYSVQTYSRVVYESPYIVSFYHIVVQIGHKS